MELSLLAAFAAGLLTFASPCVLPLVPVYLSLLAGSGDEGRRRAPVLAAVGFCAGLSAVFVALGLVASSVAGLLHEHRSALLIAGGLVIVLFGAKLLGLLRLPLFNREVRPLFQRVPALGGPLGGFVLGAAFGLGWTPCVGPVLGAVLTFAASAGSPDEAAAYLAAYALGLSLPLVVASFAAPLAARLLARVRRFTPIAERATGALMIALGVLLATDQLGVLSPDAAPTTEALACKAEGCGVELGEGEGASLEGEPRMVVFTSASCTVCARMHPVIAEAERSCAAPPGAVQRIDIGEGRGVALARRYGVRAVPTFLSVDARGEEVARLVGEQDVAALGRTLGDVRAEVCSL
jgi:cytochrome c-type biogenesis protein